MFWRTAFIFAVLATCVIVRAETIRVAAAISLREAMEQIVIDYHKQSADEAEPTFGSSGQLIAQIKSGAPVDVFISAGEAQVDELVEKGLADRKSRKVIAGNQLVLIVPADAKQEVKSFEGLADDAVKRVAIGEPKTVPAGEYAKETLEKLKLFRKIESKLVYGANVRQVLDYVERGEVSAGIVYQTDAKEAGEKVKVVATADDKLHDRIEYPAVIIKASEKQAAAKKFIDYLLSEPAQAVLKGHGFSGAESK